MAADSLRVGILGGTFDPIHCGHLDIGDAAVRALDLQRLYVIASRVPPHRPEPSASAFHRFAMVSLAVDGREGWFASDLELQAAAPSYTSTTLEAFHARGHAPRDLFFVVGADAFAEVETWHDYPTILAGAHFAVVSRPAFSVEMVAGRLPALAGRMVNARAIEPAMTAAMAPSIILINAVTMDVSSTEIRERCEAGLSIAGLVPPGVQRHIEQHDLYASQKSEAGRLHGQN